MAKATICLKDLKRHAGQVGERLSGGEKKLQPDTSEDEASITQRFVMEQIQFGPDSVQLKFEF